MTGMKRTNLAAAIHQISNLQGSFVLRSGAVATEYFDKYLFESDPRLLLRIAEALEPQIPPGTQALAGLELGGVPIATVLSQLTGLPLLSVRKKAKEYGTRRLAEGGEVSGRQLLIIEDVVTSGGQVVLSATDLRALGASVTHALCVIDRQAGGSEALAAAGIELRPLFTMDELKQAAQARVNPLQPEPKETR
jgi:orotate phosphoribosyltransferase